MYRQLVSKRFFRENPFLPHSAQKLIYSLLTAEGYDEVASELLLSRLVFSEEKRSRIHHERKGIESEEDPGAIFQLLRKDVDMINKSHLIRKALEFEETIMPMVVDKLMRNYQDTFIENAVRLLVRSKKDYSPALKEHYGEIRSPYVQSLVCVILGIRGQEELIPWMMDRFREMQRLYPDETYDQGPLFALQELNWRFYSRGKS